MAWKTSLDDDHYQNGVSLKKKLAAKIIKEDRENLIVQNKTGPRGVTAKKKADILTNLLRYMPPNLRQFWENLPVSESSVDLIDDA